MLSNRTLLEGQSAKCKWLMAPFLLPQRACNVLLNAYAQVGQSKQASALFTYMKQQGMRLDAYTYSSVIKALSRDKGKTEEVLDLFKEMQVRGVLGKEFSRTSVGIGGVIYAHWDCLEGFQYSGATEREF
jgi:pentatricopeptide repeat protein